uniref:Gamma-tubulin complex component 5 n=1 Tax=Osmerus mordax TaxID=8014 RepID=C1BIS5_OSMMO|nr:Gamma-tubulin complex component 5 [Osmerus mordax]
MDHWTQFEKDTEKETRNLITCISGIQDEEDQNFQMALKFAWSNFRFHRYLDVDSHKVQRSISGIYEKLMVHSDTSKAESWRSLTEDFLNSPLPNTDETNTDAHHSVLSLLLLLSNSPLKSNYSERPRVKEAEKQDDFDWAKYLMEGVDIDRGPFPDTPEWSEEESEEEASQQPLSRDDSGIQVDRTPQEDQENSTKTVPVSWTVGEPDARAWLEQHVVTPYWAGHAHRFPHSLHLHSNLLNVWDQLCTLGHGGCDCPCCSKITHVIAHEAGDDVTVDDVTVCTEEKTYCTAREGTGIREIQTESLLYSA